MKNRSKVNVLRSKRNLKEPNANELGVFCQNFRALKNPYIALTIKNHRKTTCPQMNQNAPQRSYINHIKQKSQFFNQKWPLGPLRGAQNAKIRPLYAFKKNFSIAKVSQKLQKWYQTVLGH